MPGGPSQLFVFPAGLIMRAFKFAAFLVAFMFVVVPLFFGGIVVAFAGVVMPSAVHFAGGVVAVGAAGVIAFTIVEWAVVVK